MTKLSARRDGVLHIGWSFRYLLRVGRAEAVQQMVLSECPKEEESGTLQEKRMFYNLSSAQIATGLTARGVNKIRQWWHDRGTLEDAKRSGRPISVVTPKLVRKAERIVRRNVIARTKDLQLKLAEAGDMISHASQAP